MVLLRRFVIGLIMVDCAVHDPDDRLLVGSEFPADPGLLTVEIFYVLGDDIVVVKASLKALVLGLTKFGPVYCVEKHAAYAGPSSPCRDGRVFF